MMHRFLSTLPLLGLALTLALALMAAPALAQCLEGNCVNGQGVKLTRGHKYSGSFKNNHRDGYGYYEYPNGDKYEGNFVEGRIEGKGIYYFVNGDKYDGEFMDGKRQGVGTYTAADGHSASGVWENDVLVQRGAEVVSEDLNDALSPDAEAQAEAQAMTDEELDATVNQILGN